VAAALAAGPTSMPCAIPPGAVWPLPWWRVATRRGLGLEVDESAVPVRDAVRGLARSSAWTRSWSANEGKLVAFVPEASSERVLQALRAHPLGRGAGHRPRDRRSSRLVTLRNAHRRAAHSRLAFGESLPRIC